MDKNKCFVADCKEDVVAKVERGNVCKVHSKNWQDFTPEGQPGTLGVNVGEDIDSEDVFGG